MAGVLRGKRSDEPFNLLSFYWTAVGFRLIPFGFRPKEEESIEASEPEVEAREAIAGRGCSVPPSFCDGELRSAELTDPRRNLLLSSHTRKTPSNDRTYRSSGNWLLWKLTRNMHVNRRWLNGLAMGPIVSLGYSLNLGT